MGHNQSLYAEYNNSIYGKKIYRLKKQYTELQGKLENLEIRMQNKPQNQELEGEK